MMLRLQSMVLLCCLCLNQQVQAETTGAGQFTSSSSKQEVVVNPPDPGQTASAAYEALTDGFQTYLSKTRDAAVKQAADLRKLYGAKSKEFGRWAKFGRAGDLLAQLPGQVLTEFPNIVSALVSASEGDVHGVMQDLADIMAGEALAAAGGGIGFMVGGPVGAGFGALGGSVVNTVFIKDKVEKKFDEMGDRRSDARVIYQQGMAISSKFKEAHQLILQAMQIYNNNEAKLNKLRADMAPVEAEKAFRDILPQMKKSRALCNKSMTWDVIETQLNRIDKQVAQLQERLETVGYYARETCGLANSLTPASRQDALRIWDSTGKPLAVQARNNNASIKDTFARIRQEWAEAKQNVSTAKNASGSAIETLFNLDSNKKEMVRQKQELASLDLSSIQTNIQEAVAKREEARTLITSARKLQGLNPRFMNPDESKQYHFESLFKSLKDQERLQDMVEETKVKAAEYDRNIGRALSWIASGESELDVCANFSFNFNEKRVAATSGKVSGALSAVPKMEPDLASTEQCLVQAQTLADRGMREKEKRPQHAPLSELVAQAQAAIKACDIHSAGQFISQLRAIGNTEAAAQADQLSGELQSKIDQMKLHIANLQVLASVVQGGDYDAIKSQISNSKRSLTCPQDKDQLYERIQQLIKSRKEEVEANRAAMRTGIDRGQAAQERGILQRRQIAESFINMATGMSRSISNGAGSAISAGQPQGRLPDVTSAGSTQPSGDAKKTCLVDRDFNTLQPETGKVYYVTSAPKSYGGSTITIYEIIAWTKGVTYPSGFASGPHSTLSEAKKVIERKCPVSQRATGSIRF